MLSSSALPVSVKSSRDKYTAPQFLPLLTLCHTRWEIIIAGMVLWYVLVGTARTVWILINDISCNDISYNASFVLITLNCSSADELFWLSPSFRFFFLMLGSLVTHQGLKERVIYLFSFKVGNSHEEVHLILNKSRTGDLQNLEKSLVRGEMLKTVIYSPYLCQ